VIAAVLIFATTYFVIAVGRLPGYRLDRAGAALLGAALMIAAGVLDLKSAYAAIDGDTIALLLGMMIVVANLRLSGFFGLVTNWLAFRARHPLVLLGGIIALVGVLSAFLVNDAICLVVTPLVLDLVTRLKRSPVPYLLAVAMASNAGSVATITGNPQNMIIGSLSNISYATFAAALAPVALAGLLLTFGLIAFLYRGEFSGRLTPDDGGRVFYHQALVIKTLAILGAMVALFFAGQPVAKVALLGGALLLFTRRVRPQKVYFEIDWPLLVMFAGLFIVVAGLEKAVLGPQLIAAAGRLRLDLLPVLAGANSCSFQHRQQCAGGAGVEAVRGGSQRSRAGLADRGHGLDAGRQLYAGRLGRQPDRGGAGTRARGRHRLLAVFQGGCAVDASHAAVRRAMAGLELRNGDMTQRKASEAMGRSTAIVIMGVAGSGKTVVGSALASRLGVPFRDADEFHPAANVAKMSSGVPLDDEDRWPWLDAIGAAIRDTPGGIVVACSALKRIYRDRIIGVAGRAVTFVYLDGDRATLAKRLGGRKGHFMPASLLDSQLATLEPPAADENAIVASIEPPVATIVEDIVARLAG
jgi:carbohydrate kinase (thermoresistant glucokinase family)